MQNFSVMPLSSEKCESRDSCRDLLFSREELEVFIEMLCIKYLCYVLNI